MPVLTARTRWLVPAAVAAAVAATAGTMVLTADASPGLPPKSAAQLLVDLQGARVPGLSGTVVQNAALGLPQLPRVAGATDLTSLVSGSNTLRVWYAGPDKVRLALLGTLGETDVIRNQRDVWTWNSDRNTYTHATLPAGVGDHPSAPPVQLPVTPQQAADQALAMVGRTTNVSIDGTASVAHRKAYELVFSPKDTRSLVGQVRIAVDAQKSVPLRVRIFAKGANQPVFEVGFTQISFATPGEEQFRFTPPRGAQLDNGQPGARIEKRGPGMGVPVKPSTPEPRKGAGTDAHEPKLVGSGWTTVAVFPAASGDMGVGSQNSVSRELSMMLDRLPRVSGSWGSGRELRGSLFTAVLTDDGRLAVGLVQPSLIYQALGAR